MNQRAEIRAAPRELGAVYTPATIVRFMVRSCLDSVRSNDGQPLRVLDPACGDGAFLIGALHAMKDRQPASPVEFCGVDVDAAAVNSTRARLRAHASPSWRFSVHHGDALTGPGFDSTNSSDPAHGIDWSHSFPQAAAAGGFDLVIGNPPYLREKDAKPVFDRIAASPLGRRWRQPRMDLWHYFLHRGLDLLKPGGALSFIVNSYWTSAVSARPLIARLQEETTIELVVLLGDAPIFDGVSGRHMILQLRKECREKLCRVLDLSETPDPLRALESAAAAPVAALEQQRTQPSLYALGRFVVSRPRDAVSCSERGPRLGDCYRVRQGIAENPPLVTRQMRAESGGKFETGAGVFVLSEVELETLQLDDGERTLLRPYCITSAIGRYVMPGPPTHWLLYLTRTTAPDIAALPNIQRHLMPFRSVLRRRREVKLGRIAWWHLHWPRQESLFTQPRILAVQMGRRPTFAFAERPTFVGFSVNVIQDLSYGSACFSLSALTAILNSAAANRWFERHAKRRGARLDVSGGILKDFPLPLFEAAADRELADLCERRRRLAVGEGAASLERLIDRLVHDSYGIDG